MRKFLTLSIQIIRSNSGIGSLTKSSGMSYLMSITGAI